MTKPIEVKNLDQDTDEWLNFRSKGIGSSDADIISGTNKWKSVIDLWEIKTGKFTPASISDNDAVKHGKELEPFARKEFESAASQIFTPKCFVHSSYDFIRASLDGINSDHTIVLEIKCPFNFSVHKKVLKTNQVPEYYYSQLQHQLLVTGAELVCYWSYTKSTGGVMIPVYPNTAYIEELLKREIEFWSCVEKDTSPKIENFMSMSDMIEV